MASSILTPVLLGGARVRSPMVVQAIPFDLHFEQDDDEPGRSERSHLIRRLCWMNEKEVRSERANGGGRETSAKVQETKGQGRGSKKTRTSALNVPCKHHRRGSVLEVRSQKTSQWVVCLLPETTSVEGSEGGIEVVKERAVSSRCSKLTSILLLSRLRKREVMGVRGSWRASEARCRGSTRA